MNTFGGCHAYICGQEQRKGSESISNEQPK